MTETTGTIAVHIASAIHLYLKRHRIGRVMFQTDYHRRKKPDEVVSPHVSFRQTTEPTVKRGAIAGMPDLAIEIKSPTNSYTGQREKAAYYLEHGCKMVWLIYPEKQLVEVYQPEQDIQILLPDEVITGGELLPGFELPVADVFAD